MNGKITPILFGSLKNIDIGRFTDIISIIFLKSKKDYPIPYG
jgi:hypothetical protein